MTQEDKELLLKDLCARLPYGVKLECKWKTPAPNGTYDMIITMDSFVLDQICNIDDTDVPFDKVKPYLFPLSSMTEEQKKEYCSLVWFDGLSAGWNRDDAIILNEVEMLIDFYHKNHLDWRGLIPMGLANDATGLNIY